MWHYLTYINRECLVIICHVSRPTGFDFLLGHSAVASVHGEALCCVRHVAAADDQASEITPACIPNIVQTVKWQIDHVSSTRKNDFAKITPAGIPNMVRTVK